MGPAPTLPPWNQLHIWFRHLEATSQGRMLLSNLKHDALTLRPSKSILLDFFHALDRELGLTAPPITTEVVRVTIDTIKRIVRSEPRKYLLQNTHPLNPTDQWSRVIDGNDFLFTYVDKTKL